MSLQEELQGPPPAKLVVDHVSKWFRQKRQTVHALEDISLEVAEGEFIVIAGPSGCGKSTLLDIIAGLEKPDQGRVLADNQPVLAPGRHRLVMFQESALFPWLNAFGNIMFGLKLKPGLRNSERREVAKFFLHLVGLEKFMEANVHELSGGMKQRVALARALAPNPRVLLMDEPFAALDAMTREQLYGDIQKIWQKRRKTIIFVTHNVREAACLADRVVIMTPTPGRIREIFEVNLPRPRDFNSIEIAQHAAKLTGLPLGLLTASLKFAEDTVGVLALGLQTLPSVCWVPLALLWFGQTEGAMLFVVIMGTVWSVVIATDTGVRTIPPIFARAARTMGSGPFHRWVHVILPASLPHLISGMKQGWAFAWRSLMAAEIYVTILTGFGLGHLLHYGRELNAMDQVIGIMLVIVLIGLLADKILFSPWERFLHRRWGTGRT